MNTDQKWPQCKECNINMRVSEMKTLSNGVFAVLFKCFFCGNGTIRHGKKWKERLDEVQVYNI